MSETQYDVDEMDVQGGLDIQVLPEITPDVQNAALTQVDERHMIAQSALDELEAALEGYDDLLALVKTVRTSSAAMRNELENATILLGAFSEGLRTIKAQRDEAMTDLSELEQAIEDCDTDHPDIAALVEYVEEYQNEWGMESAFEINHDSATEALIEVTGFSRSECSEAASQLLDVIAEPLTKTTLRVLEALIAKAKKGEG